MNQQADIKKTLQVVANHIRDRRRELRLTQEGLAEITELSTNYIARLELGLKTPSLNTIVKLAKALGMEVSDMLANEDAKWMDKTHEIAFALRSLPDSEADFLVKQFHMSLDHIKKLLND